MSPQSHPDFTASHGSIPLFSGQAGEGLVLMATIWAPGLAFILSLADVDIDILTWVLVTLIAGSLMSASWSMMKRRRFRNLVKNPELISLFEQVRRDLGTGHDIELWQRDIDRQVFISAGDIFFKAILFSESTIADILAKPEKGKTLLAGAVLEIEKKRPIPRCLVGVLLFTFIALLGSFAFFDFAERLFISSVPTMIALAVLGILALFVAVPFMTSGPSAKIDDTVERLYGTPPAAAMMDVLYGLPISEEMIEKAEREDREGPSRRRKSLRNAGVAAIVVTPVSFVASMLASSHTVFAVQFSFFMTTVVAGAAFFMVYITSNAWPMLTMGRGPRSTEWDIELPFAQQVQDFLNRQEGYEKLNVRGVKPPFDNRTGLVILRLKHDFQEETLYAIMPRMLEDLNDVELLGPLILADLKIQELESRERRVAYRVLAIAAPIFLIGPVWSFLGSGIYGVLYSFISALIIYLAIIVISATYTTFWKRKAAVKAEVEIVRRYPKYRDALRALIRNHQTLPYGMTSYKTRLERIDRQLGIHADQGVSA